MDNQTAPVEDVSVDYRRPDILVPQEFLDSANIITVFQRMGRETMVEYMGRNAVGGGRESYSRRPSLIGEQSHEQRFNGECRR